MSKEFRDQEIKLYPGITVITMQYSET